MVREFVNRVFNGSAEPLLVHLVEDRCLTEKDLAEIQKSIKTARRRAMSPVVYNLLAWTAQAGVLAIVAVGVGRLMPNPRGRLIFFANGSAVRAAAARCGAVGEAGAACGGDVSVSTGVATVLETSPSRFHIQWTPEYLLWLAAAGAGARLLWIVSGLSRLRAYRSSALVWSIRRCRSAMERSTGSSLKQFRAR